jgi:hypothetical protein
MKDFFSAVGPWEGLVATDAKKMHAVRPQRKTPDELYRLIDQPDPRAAKRKVIMCTKDIQAAGGRRIVSPRIQMERE